MTTRKKIGKPLIDTGRMLRSISSNGATVVVNTEYASEVQSRTGNYFIQKPTTALLDEWASEIISQLPPTPGSVTRITIDRG